jgi:hypothetical protein
MIDEFEGNVNVLTNVLSQHLTAGAEETTKNLNEDSRCPRRDSNRESLQ